MHFLFVTRGQRGQMILEGILEHVPGPFSVARFCIRWTRFPHSFSDAVALFMLVQSGFIFRGGGVGSFRSCFCRSEPLFAEAVRLRGRLEQFVEFRERKLQWRQLSVIFRGIRLALRGACFFS